jgi:ribosome modulation factor
MGEPMLTAAYEKGRNAAFNGKPAYFNPFIHQDHRQEDRCQHQEWEQGWADARHELRLLGLAAREGGQS